MDYEKKYNKLVNAIKVLQETNPSDEGIQNWVKDNVSELCQTEDEEMRKALIVGLNDCREADYLGWSDFGGIPIDDCITWLEKQGEQKLVEWSEEDSRKIGTLSSIIFDYAFHKDALDENQDLTGEYAELDNWLEELPERFNIQPKQEEWNEEDESQKELAETYLAVFDKHFPILPTLKGKQLADYKNFLNRCQQIFGLKYWGIRPTQAKLFEKLSLLWAAWGAEHLKGLGQTNRDIDNEIQKWSEEDEIIYTELIKYFESLLNCLGTEERHNENRRWLNWLKSLKQRLKGEQ